MVLFAAATGLRPGEWIALERRDVDRQARVVYVRRAYRNGRVKCTKTEASVRAVPLQASALAALEQVPVGTGSTLLFPRPRGAPRSVQLPQPRLETRPGGRRDHAAAARLRFCATPSRPSPFVPASPPSTFPATWEPA
jgi:integrase